MPQGGLGNLIALPLQKEARKDKNSEFIDHNFQPYSDQWAFLGTIQTLSEEEVITLTVKLGQGNELGVLNRDNEETPKPWETTKVKLLKTDFPKGIEIVKANMLFVPKAGISQRALNQLKRLAAFSNPEFYKNQAMRMSTYGKSRIICCAEDTAEYLCLPRGCEQDLRAVFSGQGVVVNCQDKTICGKKIDVKFSGTLRDEQPQALDSLLEHDIGVLSGTTAFGKTVVAIKLIAERRVNTLIIVNKAGLLAQWKNKLTEFLVINESLPVSDSGVKKRGRKKATSIIGQLGQGKNSLGGIIDIALMQSLNRKNEVRECVQEYGMIIVDECHHVAERISDTPADKQLTLVATGRYIGEGFDEPRLDTLFLTMPISWKGTLQQYAGRLHRLFTRKREVQIYDYVDIHVRMLEKMYHKRLNGYASIGYKAKAGGVELNID